MPNFPTAGNWPANANWPAGASWPSAGAWPTSGAPPFNGNFASLFPGAFQVVQTDLGLMYGGALLAAAGNTSTATMALSGSLATVPVPIQIKLTGAGITGDVYYDGGTTPAMTGVSVVATVPIALTGAAAGLSITPSAGTLVAGDAWNATCSALADQSGNAKDYSQANPSKQPIITVGLNGKPGILGDGVSINLVSLLNTPAPGTTPHYLFSVFRQITWVTNAIIIGHTTGALEIFQLGGSPRLSAYHGIISSANTGAALNAWVECEVAFSNLTSDTFKIGATTVTSPMGNTASNGLELFSLNNTRFGNAELLAFVVTPNLPNWSIVRAAVNSAAGYGVGNVLI